MGFKNKHSQKALQEIPNTFTKKTPTICNKVHSKWNNEIMHEENCENVYNQI